MSTPRQIGSNYSCIRRIVENEQDALALIDEGGVLLVAGRTMFFGHALFEGLIFDQLAMISRGVALRGSIEEADAELASLLDDAARFQSPDELPRRS